jgi:molybdenum cofactor cytidylyltransferase
MKPEIVGVVLAAGRATRFSGGVDGVTKLTALYEGVPMARRAAQAALAGGVARLVVVTGHARAQVLEALDGLPFEEAHNRDFALGIATSVRAGLRAAAPCDGALILLGDMPRVSGADVARLIAAFAQTPLADAIAPVVAGERGNPVLLSQRLFARAQLLQGDEGARRLLRDKAMRVVELEMSDNVRLDVDTPDALTAPPA